MHIGQTGAANFGGSVSCVNNSATSGGAFYIGQGGAVRGYKGTAIFGAHASFLDNTALASTGGAMHIETGAAVTFEGTSEYVNNSAALDGGAIWGRGTVTFNAPASFIGNSATGDGGAIWTVLAMAFANSSFIGNEAGGSGGVFYSAIIPDSTKSGRPGPAVSFENVILSNNIAALAGGAICIESCVHAQCHCRQKRRHRRRLRFRAKLTNGILQFNGDIKCCE